MPIAKTPPPPYYAVIFTNQRRDGDDGYRRMAERMEALAKTMPGYLGFESARDENGFGFALSYWDSEDAIKNWKRNVDHMNAQARGWSGWYEDYAVRVAKVERAYTMQTSKRL
ncbi:MAG: antibiotic biosynthesis monooxygenase family protein [Hyphococcus sp.]